MSFTGSLWGRRVKLTGLSPSASLSGFVALVSIDNVPVEAIDAGSESALNGGGDLRFSTDNAGVNQLPLEVVEYVTNATEATRRCHLFVRFPTYSSGARDVWMFYKKAAETQPAVGAAFGRDEVYQDREFQYNLHDSSTIVDSSGNSTPTVNGTLADDQTSPFGSGVAFDTAENIDLGANVGGTTGDMTLRSWVEAPTSTSFSTIASIRVSTSWSWQWRLEMNDPSILIGTTSPNSPGVALTQGVWYNLTVTISGTSITFYRDGASEGGGTVTEPRSVLGGTNTFIAAVSDGQSADYIGSLADISVEFGAISSDLVSSEYDNKSDAATFWTTGTPEDTTASISISVPAGSYTLLGRAPVVVADGNLLISVPDGSYLYTGLSPTVLVEGPVIVSVAAGAYSFTGLVPLVITDIWTSQADAVTIWAKQA